MLPIIASIECPADRDLMEDYYEKHIKLLFSEAHKHLSNPQDIEDIVSEALTRIIGKMDVFRTLTAGQRIRYGIVTVRNLCYTHMRKNNQPFMLSLDDICELPDSETPESMAEHREQEQQMREILASLDQDDRMLLEQKHILCWTDQEIAELYGVKTDSIRTKVSRARHNLLVQIEARNYRFPPNF